MIESKPLTTVGALVAIAFGLVIIGAVRSSKHAMVRLPNVPEVCAEFQLAGTDVTADPNKLSVNFQLSTLDTYMLMHAAPVHGYGTRFGFTVRAWTALPLHVRNGFFYLMDPRDCDGPRLEQMK